MAAVRCGYSGSRGVVGVTGPVEEYLRLSSAFAVGLVMVVVMAVEGPNGPGADPDPSLGQVAHLVVARGLLGLPMLGSYSRVRFLQRRRAVGDAEPCG